MAEQATLTDPIVHSLWTAYVDGHRINHSAWMHAINEGGFVGTCRHCGDYLAPLRPQTIVAGRTDYEARCRNDACRWETCAPGGRVGKMRKR